MRDDSARWTPPAGVPERLNLGSATLQAAGPLRHTLISGPGLALQGDAATGWPDIATGETYRIALRRDRLVEIGGTPIETEGWDTRANRATSDISAAYAVFDLSGADALSILMRGTELSLETSSGSVARKLFGLDVWVYRHGQSDRFRLHVAHAFKEALIGNLKAAAALAAT